LFNPTSTATLPRLIDCSQYGCVWESNGECIEDFTGISTPNPSVQQLPKYVNPGQTSIDLSLRFSKTKRLAD
jgi:hypothetical protein